MSLSHAVAASAPLRRARAAGRWALTLPRRFSAYGVAFLFVATATLIAEALYRSLGLTRVSPIFLAAVLISAVRLGTQPAFFAATLAFSIYNFYMVEPRLTFSLDSPEEILTLMLFLTVAMLTGGLAGRVRDEAERSKLRAATTAALFEASRELSATDDEDVLRASLARHIARGVRGEAEIRHEARVWRAAAGEPAEWGWTTRELSAGGQSLGEARWRSGGPAPAPEREVQDLVQVLVDLGAAAILRSRLALEKAEIESLARTEQLRTALLSSVSHDFRTPLTAILTSTTSLREFGDRFEAAVKDDLLSTIQEEAERLNGYVANLLSFTKLESGALQVEPGPISVAETVGRVLQRCQARAGARVFALHLEPGLHAYGDPFLLEQALSNVVENAIRFGPPASTVEIGARRAGEAVELQILDEGPGVPAHDQDRIFEKFYRSSATAGQQGTGLGLSIARGMVEAMGGRIRADRRSPEGGLAVSITLPAADIDGA